MHLRLSKLAEADLEQIKEYFEPLSQQGYVRMIAALFAAMDQLEVFPFLGREGKVEGTRELTVPRTPYRIVYTLPDEYNIDVERILHERLKYPSEE
jgi:toxin ParE1/3/4